MFHFDTAYAFTSKWEGGVCDVPGDRGGKTAYGLSSKYHPELFEGGRIPTKEEVKNVFHREYWLANKCDRLNSVISAIWLFDVAINSGRTGVKQWQRVVGVEADGIVGGKSIAASDALPHLEINRAMLAERTAFYERLAKKPGQEKFLKGWLNRARDCHSYCIDLL